VQKHLSVLIVIMMNSSQKQKKFERKLEKMQVCIPVNKLLTKIIIL